MINEKALFEIGVDAVWSDAADTAETERTPPSIGLSFSPFGA